MRTLKIPARTISWDSTNRNVVFERGGEPVCRLSIPLAQQPYRADGRTRTGWAIDNWIETGALPAETLGYSVENR